MSTPRKTKTPAIVHQPDAQLYDRFVADIKQRIRTAQIKAVLAANAELVLHYWEIGRDILASQKQEGWGTKVIDRLAADLQREFPTLSGYAARNLKYMRAFAAAWPDRSIVQQLAAQIPWMHNCVLLDRVKDAATREFYIRKTVEHGWSRSVLMHQLDTELHKRSGNPKMPFPNPNGIESISPGLARSDYPGWTKTIHTTPTGLHQAGHGRRCNPFRVEDVCFTVSQGSSCRATLGWMMESRWDSRMGARPARDLEQTSAGNVAEMLEA